jgi:methionyl-tRNA synthetase
MKKPFYITTTLPYVNAEPHIGFAMELIRADIVARSKKLAGFDVFFNTGTDEHGLKVHQSAAHNNLDTQTYVDQASAKFKDILGALGIATDEPGIKFNFIRTTDPHHVKAAQAFWSMVDKNGYIYKKNYSVKYCVGCELEKTDSELVDGKCPLHPLMQIENIEEENYFFKFSAFKDKLLALYEGQEPYKNRSALVIPDFRFNEIKAFVGRGLEDFSISRLASKMPWGISVPGDDSQVMYVWFDALVNYISAVGWPDDTKSFEKWCGTGANETGGMVQYCGKDNLRQQSAMWQAMLMAAGLPPSKTIVIDGFITGEGGLKMSKSLGNTVDPLDIVKQYGTDALRYYVAREISPFEDSPFTMERFKEAYNANLANGVGNLTSRVMKMATSNGISSDDKSDKKVDTLPEIIEWRDDYHENLESFNIQGACNAVWQMISAADTIIQERQPFKKIKVDKAEAEKDIQELLARLHMIGTMLLPILPQTGSRIVGLVERNEMPAEPLFMRK